jgi:hypothetical protein
MAAFACELMGAEGIDIDSHGFGDVCRECGPSCARAGDGEPGEPRLEDAATVVEVTNVTLLSVTDNHGVVRWLVLVVRMPADPSRHRVAVWRELRRVGALQIGQGVWVVPDVAVFADGVARVIELAHRGEGEVLVLDATGRADADAARLKGLFTADRAEEWAEFLTECTRFDAEIDKEIAKSKFTMAELEEEEHSLERLRRWHRDITARDVFTAPAATEAGRQLTHCADRLADYTERVFAALHQM